MSDPAASWFAASPPAPGDQRVRVAILDGPVDLTHPAFVGADLTTVGPASRDGAGRALAHGTHVASILFGQPGSDVAGVAPRCHGILIPIFSDDSGRSCSQLDLARAIDLAISHGAHVINVSGGQPVASTQPDVLLAQALARCAERNVLVVAAAGNDGCACLHMPAAARGVLAVGAMDRDGRPLSMSNWGGAYLTQGLLAPGQDILGAVPGGGVARRSGTSFAAPCVSGVAALLIGMQLAQGQTPDPLAVKAVLLTSATRCDPEGPDDCRRVLAGRLNIRAAIQQIQGEVLQMSDIAMPASSSAQPSVDDIMAMGQIDTIMPPDVARPAAMPPAATPMAGLQMSAHPLPSRSPLAASESMARGVSGTPEIAPSCGCGGKCACGGTENCSCGAGESHSVQLVYALGKLGYDFGTEARRDSFIQAMSASVDAPSTASNPHVVGSLLSYLDKEVAEAPALIWTLNLDATPIYAIEPTGAFAAVGYEKLRRALHDQERGDVEIVSIPGIIGGSVRLQSGQIVPVIVPAQRGMYAWRTRDLLAAALGPRPDDAKQQKTYDIAAEGLNDFVNRVYYELRNLGLTPEDRALNYSATNAVQAASVIKSATGDGLNLDRLNVRRSPVCRPDSECFDVEVSFFNPDNTNIASRVFRFTVDVSDVIPVSIGAVRRWARR